MMLRPHTYGPLPSPLLHSDGQVALRTVLAWADSCHARVLNRPAASTLNMSKPLQLMAMAKYGFMIPQTLVTTTIADVLAFRDRVGEVIYKSVSATRSVVRRLGPEQDADLMRVPNCPTQFQEYVPGDDVRVHVIGDHVDALLIQSSVDDYRYAGLHGASVTAVPLSLAPELADRIRAMVRAMRLELAGVDLRRTPDGQWYGLEVNPSPGFTFYERISSVDIAPKIAALLVEGEPYER